jgi:hypothetical protein
MQLSSRRRVPCFRSCFRKHAQSAILAAQDHNGPTSVEGTCFRKRLRKRGTTEARTGRKHATGLTLIAT